MNQRVVSTPFRDIRDALEKSSRRTLETLSIESCDRSFSDRESMEFRQLCRVMLLQGEAWTDWVYGKPHDAPCGVMWNAIVRVQNGRRSNAR